MSTPTGRGRLSPSGRHPKRSVREASSAERASEARDIGVLADAFVARFGLTRRQRHVLELVAIGLRNKVIAARLGCAEVTVEYHLTAVLKKSGCENRLALAVKFWSRDGRALRAGSSPKPG